MKITISHDQTSIDPSAVYSDELYAEVVARLENEYTKELSKAYPEAEIEFGNDTTYGVRVTGADRDVDYDVQTICESVFETGLFW